MIIQTNITKTKPWRRGSFVCAITLALSACSSFNIQPPVVDAENMCHFKRHELNVNDTQIDTSVANALAQHSRLPLLYLSGGSQNGAFGAGYISGWANKNNGKLPEFAIVTGVSTGAILSLSAFANVPEAALNGYQIDSESDVLDLYVLNKGGKLSISDYLAAFKKGAVADLAPMKSETKSILKEYGLIAKISQRAAENRKLFVAAVDVDTGYAVAFDLTDMAQRIEKASISGNAEQENLLTNCFVDAVAASSSAPLAAQPVFIDNRMYIDGGVRFGIISDRIGQLIETTPIPQSAAGPQKRQVYVIINGDQEISKGCKICGTVPEGIAHKDWNLIDLAFRSIGILSDQVYQFSEYKAIADGQAQNSNYDMSITLIRSDKDDHVWNGKSCPDWKTQDKAEADIVEFHPNYMKCLIDYGRKKAANEDW